MAGLTAHRSYLSGERSLASDTIWHLKLESIENQQYNKLSVCILSPNAGKLNPDKQSYQETHLSVPL